jgi:peroxin-12
MTCQTIANRLRRAFKMIYPYANAAYELWLLWYNIAYLFDKSAFYRPWLKWIGVDLRRLGPEDYVRLNKTG